MQHEEKFIRVTVSLEEEMVDELRALQKEYSKETGQKWSLGAVIRLALSEFFAKRGQIL